MPTRSLPLLSPTGGRVLEQEDSRHKQREQAMQLDLAWFGCPIKVSLYEWAFCSSPLSVVTEFERNAAIRMGLDMKLSYGQLGLRIWQLLSTHWLLRPFVVSHWTARAARVPRGQYSRLTTDKEASIGSNYIIRRSSRITSPPESREVGFLKESLRMIDVVRCWTFNSTFWFLILPCRFSVGRPWSTSSDRAGCLAFIPSRLGRQRQCWLH